MTKKAYDSGRVRYVAQDGSREFISLLAGICADGTALPPALIYQGASGDLQNTWVQDLQEGEQAYFGSAPNGWSSDAFGLAYLKRFDQNTAHKSTRRRLLIVDGHSSHVNMAFVNACDQLRILLMVFPPHTTHRLQPLDVALFSPLAQSYSTEMTKITHGGQGWVSMTKRSFWAVFKEAWKQSFTEKNIKKAFAATGIWPLKPLKIVEKLKAKAANPCTPPPAAIRGIPTPANCRAVRHLGQLPLTAQNYANSNELAVKLYTKLELANHEIGQLQAALCDEKGKRTRGKRLNLVGDVATGEAQLFSPRRVAQAQAHAQSLEAAKEEEQRQKDLQKAEKERVRIQRLAEQQEAKLQKEAERQLAKEVKEAAESEKRAQTAQVRAERARKAQEKAEAVQRRRLLQQQKKEAATVAAAKKSDEKAERVASKRGKKVAPNSANPLQNAAEKLNGSATPSPAKILPLRGHGVAAIDLTVDPPATRSRSGRTLHKPTGFLY